MVDTDEAVATVLRELKLVCDPVVVFGIVCFVGLVDGTFVFVVVYSPHSRVHRGCHLRQRWHHVAEQLVAENRGCCFCCYWIDSRPTVSTPLPPLLSSSADYHP